MRAKISYINSNNKEVIYKRDIEISSIKTELRLVFKFIHFT